MLSLLPGKDIGPVMSRLSSTWLPPKELEETIPPGDYKLRLRGSSFIYKLFHSETIFPHTQKKHPKFETMMPIS